MLKVPPRCSEPIFSQALAELEAIHGKAYRNYTDDHTKLFLTVQNKALQGRSQLRHGWRTPKPLEFRIILIGTSDLVPRRRHGFSLKLVNACMNLTDLSPDFCRACADATVYHSGMEPSRSAYTWRFYLAMASRRVRQECDLDCHWPRVELVRKPQEPRVAYTPSKYQRIPSICPRLNSLLVIS